MKQAVITTSPHLFYPESRLLVDPFIKPMAGIVRDAWRLLKEECPPNVLAKMDTTGIAKLVHRYMVDRLLWLSREGLEYFEPYHGMHLLGIRGRGLARFKKLDALHYTKNIPTKIQRDLLKGMPDLFGDVGYQFLVNIGWVPTLAGESYERIVVVHTVNREHEWTVELDSELNITANRIGTLNLFEPQAEAEEMEIVLSNQRRHPEQENEADYIEPQVRVKKKQETGNDYEHEDAKRQSSQD